MVSRKRFGTLLIVFIVAVAAFVFSIQASTLFQGQDQDLEPVVEQRQEGPQALATATYRAPAETVYVVDPRGGELSSHILVVDVATLHVAQTIQTRYKPDLAVGAGSLYIVDSYSPTGLGKSVNGLSLLSLSDGTLQRDIAELPDRTIYQLLPRGSGVTLSPDESLLYYQKHFGVGVFDIDNRQLLSDLVHENCEIAALRVSSQFVYVTCTSGTVVTFDSNGTKQILDLPTFPGHAQQPGNAYLQAAALVGERLVLLTNEGQLFDLAERGQSASKASIMAESDWKLAETFGVAVSPDQARLYVGFSKGQSEKQQSEADSHEEELSTGNYNFQDYSSAYEYMVEQIWVYDTQDWRRTEVIQLPVPILNFTLSKDGKHLYGVNPFTREMTILDAYSGQEVGRMSNLGVTPALVIVAP